MNKSLKIIKKDPKKVLNMSPLVLIKKKPSLFIKKIFKIYNIFLLIKTKNNSKHIHFVVQRGSWR